MPRKSAASAVASLKRSAMKPDDDLPEVTDAMLADAELRVGERVIRRGRPPSAAPKEAIKLQIDRDVLAYYRAGWPRRQRAQRDFAGPPGAAQPSNAQAKGGRGALARRDRCGADGLPRGSPSPSACTQWRTDRAGSPGTACGFSPAAKGLNMIVVAGANSRLRMGTSVAGLVPAIRAWIGGRFLRT